MTAISCAKTLLRFQARAGDPPAFLVPRCEDRFSSAHDLRFALMAPFGSEESVSGQIAPTVAATQTTFVPKTRTTILRPAV